MGGGGQPRQYRETTAANRTADWKDAITFRESSRVAGEKHSRNRYKVREQENTSNARNDSSVTWLNSVNCADIQE